jgi:hypothetical protein
MGSHGGCGVNNSDVILASSSSIETEGFYVNSFGFKQKSSKILFNAGNSRGEMSILLALNLYFKCSNSVAENSLRLYDNDAALSDFELSRVEMKIDFTVSSGDFVELILPDKKMFFTARLSSLSYQLRESLKLLRLSKILSVASLTLIGINNNFNLIRSGKA